MNFILSIIGAGLAIVIILFAIFTLSVNKELKKAEDKVEEQKKQEVKKNEIKEELNGGNNHDNVVNSLDLLQQHKGK